MSKIMVWIFTMCLVIANTLIVKSLGYGIDTWQWWAILTFSNLIQLCGRAMETED